MAKTASRKQATGAGSRRAGRATKRGSVKRAAVKRAGTKRTATKRTATKRTAAKRAATKRTEAKRAATKRVATKRAATKRAAGSRDARQPARPRRPTRRSAAKSTRRPPAEKPQSTLAKVATAVKGTVAGAVAAVSRTVGGSPGDGITLLEADHRRLEDLLKRGEATTGRAVKERRSLLQTITAELHRHEQMEEQVLYPALAAHPEAKDIVAEGFQEHHLANVVVEELHEVAADTEQWQAKFGVLKENIQHHIDEEEGEMFRTARAVFSEDELETMGERMAALKTE